MSTWRPAPHPGARPVHLRRPAPRVRHRSEGRRWRCSRFRPVRRVGMSRTCPRDAVVSRETRTGADTAEAPVALGSRSPGAPTRRRWRGSPRAPCSGRGIAAYSLHRPGTQSVPRGRRHGGAPDVPALPHRDRESLAGSTHRSDVVRVTWNLGHPDSPSGRRRSQPSIGRADQVAAPRRCARTPPSSGRAEHRDAHGIMRRPNRRPTQAHQVRDAGLMELWPPLRSDLHPEQTLPVHAVSPALGSARNGRTSSEPGRAAPHPALDSHTKAPGFT